MPFIPDVAPIVDDAVADIGYAGCLGEHALHAGMRADLIAHRVLILRVSAPAGRWRPSTPTWTGWPSASIGAIAEQVVRGERYAVRARTMDTGAGGGAVAASG